MPCDLVKPSPWSQVTHWVLKPHMEFRTLSLLIFRALPLPVPSVVLWSSPAPPPPHTHTQKKVPVTKPGWVWQLEANFGLCLERMRSSWFSKIVSQARSQPSRWGGGGVWTWMGGTQARIQIQFTSTPPPPLDIARVMSSALWKIEKHPHSWTFTSSTPLDIVRVTSSALWKIEKHPHSWTFTSSTPPWTLSAWCHPPSEKLKNTPTLGHSEAPPPPWTLPVWRHPHSKGGWSVTHTLHRFSVSGQVQGGVIIPVTPPPPRIHHWNTIQGMVGLSISWQKQGV